MIFFHSIPRKSFHLPRLADSLAITCIASQPRFFSAFRLCDSASRCLSTTHFRIWSNTMLQEEQNNRSSSTWNVPLGYFLALSFAEIFTGRFDFFFSSEEVLSVLTTNLSIKMWVSIKRRYATYRLSTIDYWLDQRAVFMPILTSQVWRDQMTSLKYINDCNWCV